MSKLQHCQSILDTVDTGFGEDNTLVIKPPKPSKLTSHLIYLTKDNYLSEFATKEEKQKLRSNLQVYSKEEVKQLISNITVTEIQESRIKEIIEEYNYITAEPYKK